MNIDIQKRLHHRPPYLLIDEVIEASDKALTARKYIGSDEYYMAGHFPGAPVVPGAMLQEMTTQSAGVLIAQFHCPVADYDSQQTKGYALGVLTQVYRSKFKHFARTGDELIIKVKLKQQLENSFRFSASVSCEDRVIMKNEFTLANLSDQVLARN